MVLVRYIRFGYRNERLWLRITRINDNHVIRREWHRPINQGMLFGQLIGVPFKDVLDVWYEFAIESNFKCS